MSNRISTSRKRAICNRVVRRLPDILHTKLARVWQARSAGLLYLTGPGQAHRESKVLWELHEMDYLEPQRWGERGAFRWELTDLGRLYFSDGWEQEDHSPQATGTEPRTYLLLQRVWLAREEGSLFASFPGTKYEDELCELQRRGLLKSRFLSTGRKAGRRSWSLTEEGEAMRAALAMKNR